MTRRCTRQRRIGDTDRWIEDSWRIDADGASGADFLPPAENRP